MSGPAATSDLLVGRVQSYDYERGLGEVVVEDGGTWTFQCTSIIDGSRRIEPGRAVAFVVVPAGPGHWEARNITPL